MKFAYRRRSTEITLGVGQSKRYLLPPMTAGSIHVSVHSVFLPGEIDPPDEGTGTPSLPFDPNIVRSDGAPADSGAATGDDGPWVIERNDNGGSQPPGGGSDSGASPDVSIELKRLRKTIKTGWGSVVHETPVETSDWNIVLTRRQ